MRSTGSCSIILLAGGMLSSCRVLVVVIIVLDLCICYLFICGCVLCRVVLARVLLSERCRTLELGFIEVADVIKVTSPSAPRCVQLLSVCHLRVPGPLHAFSLSVSRAWNKNCRLFANGAQQSPISPTSRWEQRSNRMARSDSPLQIHELDR